jgi:serine protease AprX
MTSFVYGHPRLRPRLHLRVGAAVVALATAALAWTLVAGGGSPTARPGSGTPAAAGTAPRPGSLSAPLARLAADSPSKRVEVIIQLARGAPLASGRVLVRSLGGRPGLSLPIINGLSARLTASASRRLGASPLVRAVSLNAAIKTQAAAAAPAPRALTTNFDRSVDATKLWRRTTGQGVGVAVIDTGITGDLPDFHTSQSSSTSRVVASAVIDPGAGTANDTYGHGTAVAGLIAGNGDGRASGDAVWGQYAGTAPNANLISIKIADDAGHSTILDAIYGLQFAVDHQNEYNIRVVNLSFRSTTPESYTTDPLDAAAEQAWLHGIVVVAAAGNMGTASDAVSYAPGNDPFVLTVGAVDEQGTPRTSDDVTASWSSQGSTQDGVRKPDVLAPGAHIVSTLAPGSDFASSCPTCVISGAYFQASGTSLAAPIVAGIAADLVAAHPSWTPAQVKGAIVNTAVRVSDGGHEVNAVAANAAAGDQLTADQNLTPSTLINPGTGSIDYSTASWSTASWSTATDPLTASWSTASWSCVDCSPDSAATVDPATASWSTLGWTTMWG